MSNTAQAITSLAGAGGTVNLNFGHTLTVTQAGDTTFAGNLNGSGAIIKAGNGTLKLTGPNFGFIGATTINQGTLLVAGSLSGSAISIAGGTLGGGGFVGNVTSVGGTIAPGEGPGTLNTSNVDGDAFGNWRFELATPGVEGGGVNDLLQITGSLTLDGTLQVQRLPGFGGGIYRLANYTGTLTDNGLILDPAFAQLYPGSIIDTSTVGQVNLVVVPEPASAAFLVSGLGLLAGFSRRRRA
jgi:fibronectin-binding autotransporter adhesin